MRPITTTRDRMFWLPSSVMVIIMVVSSLAMSDDHHQLKSSSSSSSVVVASAALMSAGRSRGFFGDFCDDTDQCSPSGLPHTVCNAMTQRCECDPLFPIVVDNAVCIPALKLGETCLYDQSCTYYDRNALCGPVQEIGQIESGSNECQCREEFQPSITLESITRTSICIPVPHGPWLKSDVPTVIGLGVGMSLFMALTCLVLKLFSRARFAQEAARGYGNAHLAPPTTPQHQQQHPDGPAKHRHSCHRQISITESETAAATAAAAAAGLAGEQSTGAAARRTNSISNGGAGHQHRTAGSFHGPARRQSNHSAAGERSPRRGTSIRDHHHHQHQPHNNPAGEGVEHQNV